MTTTDVAFVDPRVRVRSALRDLVSGNSEWASPSLTVFRNRLLDLTGSDARPLADLLLDAIERGLPIRAGAAPLSSAAWDALIAPFILRWSAERFVQPDMARWAAECWGYAFGMIGAGQLRIAPIVAPAAIPKPITAHTASSPVQTPRGSVAGVQTGASPRAVTAPTRVPAGARMRGTPARVVAGAPGPSSMRGGGLAKGTLPRTASRASTTHVNPWISRVLFLGLMASGVGLVAYVSVASDASAAPPARDRASAAPPVSASLAANGSGVATEPVRRPGVPSITRAVAEGARADSARMLFVEPARRAAGNSRPMIVAPAGGAVALDEIRLTDGNRMRGRVEVVRAGTVVFRDVHTGLRYEIVKDNVSEIITEFGTSVRFSDAPLTASLAAPASRARKLAERAPPPDVGSVRARGVSGRYVVRYEKAFATGSPDCAAVWQRAPDAVDLAVVQHRPGADTLTLAFEGGDTFPSNVDREGRFASTFRIVPDQARSSTALTTRLTGQFAANGSLAMTVNIVFFRRMRAGGDLACNVTVNAVGQRESP